MTEPVLRELREAIIEGRIPQGEPLREVPLAGTLGTGRSAVREAIRQLVQEGLVDYEPHRGASVRVLSLGDLLDVYVAREAIEAGGARRGPDAGRPPPAAVRAPRAPPPPPPPAHAPRGPPGPATRHPPPPTAP